MFKFESRTRFLKRRRREYFDALHDGFVIRGGKKNYRYRIPRGTETFLNDTGWGGGVFFFNFRNISQYRKTTQGIHRPFDNRKKPFQRTFLRSLEFDRIQRVN